MEWNGSSWVETSKSANQVANEMRGTTTPTASNGGSGFQPGAVLQQPTSKPVARSAKAQADFDEAQRLKKATHEAPTADRSGARYKQASDQIGGSQGVDTLTGQKVQGGNYRQDSATGYRTQPTKPSYVSDTAWQGTSKLVSDLMGDTSNDLYRTVTNPDGSSYQVMTDSAQKQLEILTSQEKANQERRDRERAILERGGALGGESIDTLINELETDDLFDLESTLTNQNFLDAEEILKTRLDDLEREILGAEEQGEITEYAQMQKDKLEAEKNLNIAKAQYERDRISQEVERQTRLLNEANDKAIEARNIRNGRLGISSSTNEIDAINELDRKTRSDIAFMQTQATSASAFLGAQISNVEAQYDMGMKAIDYNLQKDIRKLKDSFKSEIREIENQKFLNTKERRNAMTESAKALITRTEARETAARVEAEKLAEKAKADGDWFSQRTEAEVFPDGEGNLRNWKDNGDGTITMAWFNNKTGKREDIIQESGMPPTQEKGSALDRLSIDKFITSGTEKERERQREDILELKNLGCKDNEIADLLGVDIEEEKGSSSFDSLSVAERLRVDKFVTGGTAGERKRQREDVSDLVSSGLTDQEISRATGIGGFDPAEKSDFEQKLEKRVSDITKSYSNMNRFFGNIEEGVKAFRIADKEGKDLTAASQAIIFGWNKMLDEGSVVRESEYDRTGESQSLLNRISGRISKLEQGGDGLTLGTVESVLELSEKLKERQDIIKVQRVRPQFNSAEKYGLDKSNIFTPSLLAAMQDTIDSESAPSLGLTRDQLIQRDNLTDLGLSEEEIDIYYQEELDFLGAASNKGAKLQANNQPAAPAPKRTLRTTTLPNGVSMAEGENFMKVLVEKGSKMARDYLQCGSFINMLVGGTLWMKDTIEEKREKVSSRVPRVGSIAVHDRNNNWGHASFVEKVFNLGGKPAIQIVESNNNSDGKVGRRLLTWNGKNWIDKDGKEDNIFGFSESVKSLPKQRRLGKFA